MAIAYDNATNGGSTTATSLTFSHVSSGTNPFILVTILGRVGATSNITGVTYNSAALTKLDGAQLSPGDRYLEVWYGYGFTVGTANVVISASTSDFISANTVTYNGVNQGALDATGTNFKTTGTPNTNTITAIASGAWHIMGGGNASGIPTAGTNSTLRSTANGNLAMFDSNGTVTGSHSLGMTGMNSSFGSGTIGATIAPPSVASNTNSGFFALMRR